MAYGSEIARTAAATRVLAIVSALGVLAAPALAQAGGGLPDRATAVRIAAGTAAVRHELAQHPRVRPAVLVRRGRVEVRYLHNEEEGTTVVIGPGGRIERIWTGYQATSDLTRGIAGAVGGLAASVWVWLPLTVLFLVPFVDLKRVLSWRNADLVALLSLSVSFAFFNTAHLGWSVPLMYPPFVYLGWRMLVLGGRGQVESGVTPNVPVRWLAWALVPLGALRVVLALASRIQLDVATFTMAGAHQLSRLEPLYGSSVFTTGDHYGPVTYLAYAPFEALWPFVAGAPVSAGAHWAPIVFDLLTLALLAVLAARIGGRAFAIVIAYGWVTLPLGLLALCSGTNDGLVALLVTASVLALPRPWLAGAVAGLSALTKVAPALLLPLLATHPGIGAPSTRARAPRFVGGMAIAAGLALVPVLIHTSPQTFYERTVNSEIYKYSPLSIWGLYDPEAHSYLAFLLESLARAGAVILAILVAVRPKQRTDMQAAALAAAVLVAIQISGSYWLYPYVVWFLPLVLLALLAPYASRAAISASPKTSYSAR